MNNNQNNENLKRFAINLCERARDGKLDPVIGRDDEIRRVLQILSRRTKNNPILIGEPGVGKTAIITAVSVLTNLLNNPNYLSNSESLVLLNELMNKKFRGRIVVNTLFK